MLSKEAIQAAMSQRADHASQKEDASSRVDAKQALSAVAGIVLAPKVQAQSKYCIGVSTAPIEAFAGRCSLCQYKRSRDFICCDSQTVSRCGKFGIVQRYS